ncbi:hypothetical protein [Amycolatopsis sp. Hca4]|uniref:hypothetical protein n=1 Tax=unclassified Amycolatopsis TaxID=2618356 RepID=UPI0015928461|nr:hypothetical protein [Amycolatopsis sp. Hca4]QKV76970.1 hypothetical protein HUT10_26710 [Amycolatopsis sp. Hca4]
MDSTTMKRAGAAVLGAGALAAAGLLGAGTASAADLPKGTHSAVSGQATTDHVQSWVTTFYDGSRWEANVRVDYGRTGAWTHCSDGADIYGPAQGPGYWIFGGNCYGHGTITNYGWYDA